jgi:hypothetical protein
VVGVGVGVGVELIALEVVAGLEVDLGQLVDAVPALRALVHPQNPALRAQVGHRDSLVEPQGRTTVDASPVTRSTSRLASGRTNTPWSCASPATMALSQSSGSSKARSERESCATATSSGPSPIENHP